MSAAPIGVPGCPERAFSTASAARNRIVWTQSCSTSVVTGVIASSPGSWDLDLLARCIITRLSFHLDPGEPMRHRGRMLRLVLVVLLASASMGGLACATNPATGSKEISFVSRGRELEMGREADPAIIAEYGLYGDKALAGYVDSLGQRLAKVSHLPDLDWHFRLLD